MISGNTRIYGILADPIAQVQTPRLMNALIMARDIDAMMVPLHVGTADLPNFVQSLRSWKNFGGFIATVPHKVAMLDLCDIVSDRARLIGAANTVRREPDGTLAADMLDGHGFVEGLRSAGIEPRGMRVFLAGAGGAACAVAFGLAEAGISQLTLGNRTPAKAQDLKSRLGVSYPTLNVMLSTDPAGHDLAVNGTSLGMREIDPFPFDVARLDSPAIVAEIIMEPKLTPLLAASQARQLKIHFGRPMLDAQISLMAQFLGL